MRGSTLISRGRHTAFSAETIELLTDTVELINWGGPDHTLTREELDGYLRQRTWSTVSYDDEELEAVRELQARLRHFWTISDAAAASGYVNRLLTDSQARPRLVAHESLGWQVDLVRPGAGVVDRIGAGAAVGFCDLIVHDGLARRLTCAGSGCDNVLVDLSKNRSRMYCDLRRCANRTHVAAYRRRQRASR